MAWHRLMPPTRIASQDKEWAAWQKSTKQPSGDKCLADFKSWKKHYGFLDWQQFCTLYRGSDAFKDEVVKLQTNPDLTADFAKSSVEQTAQFGMMIKKKCWALTAAQVKKLTGQTPKKLKLPSIVQEEPGQDAEELFLLGDASKPYKRVVAFAVHMDTDRVIRLDPSQHVLKSQSDVLLRHLRSQDSMSSQAKACFGDLVDLENFIVHDPAPKETPVAAKVVNDIANTADLDNMLPSGNGTGEGGASDGEGEEEFAEIAEECVVGAGSRSSGRPGAQAAKRMNLVDDAMSVAATPPVKRAKSYLDLGDVGSDLGALASSGASPRADDALSSATSAWEGIPRNEHAKCKYWIDKLSLQLISEGGNFKRSLRQANDLLRRNANTTDTKLKAEMNLVKTHLGLVALGEKVAPENLHSQTDEDVKGCVELLHKHGVRFDDKRVQDAFVARRLSRLAMSDKAYRPTEAECAEFVRVVSPWAMLLDTSTGAAEQKIKTKKLTPEGTIRTTLRAMWRLGAITHCLGYHGGTPAGTPGTPTGTPAGQRRNTSRYTTGTPGQRRGTSRGNTGAKPAAARATTTTTTATRQGVHTNKLLGSLAQNFARMSRTTRTRKRLPGWGIHEDLRPQRPI